MAEYISSNPDIIVNGFIKSGISTFLSQVEDDDNENDDEDDDEDESDESESDEDDEDER